MPEKHIRINRLNKRYILGSIILLAGIVFMFIPFIPLGYILLAVGCFLLYPAVPPLKKLLDYLKRKDNSDRIEKAQKKTNEFLGKMENNTNREKRTE
ncbi:hypothetical protein [Saccharicrinis sp. FJH54]|uniref:hypothetical protein n=1 Tax=Saccharicrinis sp. FJH54 TaxID=3344665 RepID=UPI0035D4B11D